MVSYCAVQTINKNHDFDCVELTYSVLCLKGNDVLLEKSFTCSGAQLLYKKMFSYLSWYLPDSPRFKKLIHFLGYQTGL